MQSSERRLERILSAAREAPPAAVAPASSREVQYFSERIVKVWKKNRLGTESPDPLLLWERVGAWSLGAAVAALVLILSLGHNPVKANPFEPFGPEKAEEIPFFAVTQ
jgi:hypothetical protein